LQRLILNPRFKFDITASIHERHPFSSLCFSLRLSAPCVRIAGKIVFVVPNNTEYQKHTIYHRRIGRTTGINLVFIPPYSPNLNLIGRYGTTAARLFSEFCGKLFERRKTPWNEEGSGCPPP
jgi:hypothetical protein